MPNKWGGFAAPTFSDVSFWPDMFSDSWPPPATASIRLMWMDGEDETDTQIIFDGTAIRSELARDFVSYDLKRPENDTKVSESTVYSDTLINVMTTLCGATFLNLTIDTTRARSTSPAVSYTTTAEQLTIDLASDLCAFFSHGFYIVGTTLYLVDMNDISTSTTELTEWDILPSAYRYDKPYSSAKSGDYTVYDTSVANGEELSISTAYHGTQANIEAALTMILGIANRPTIEINAMITERAQQIAGCYSFTDESHFLPLHTSMIVYDIVYNFDDEKLQATGPGAIS
jgi:hypothetical protein